MNLRTVVIVFALVFALVGARAGAQEPVETTDPEQKAWLVMLTTGLTRLDVDIDPPGLLYTLALTRRITDRLRIGGEIGGGSVTQEGWCEVKPYRIRCNERVWWKVFGLVGQFSLLRGSWGSGFAIGQVGAVGPDTKKSFELGAGATVRVLGGNLGVQTRRRTSMTSTGNGMVYLFTSIYPLRNPF